jgi:hypothetical protein
LPVSLYAANEILELMVTTPFCIFSSTAGGISVAKITLEAVRIIEINVIFRKNVEIFIL